MYLGFMNLGTWPVDLWDFGPLGNFEEIQVCFESFYFGNVEWFLVIR